MEAAFRCRHGDYSRVTAAEHQRLKTRADSRAKARPRPYMHAILCPEMERNCIGFSRRLTAPAACTASVCNGIALSLRGFPHFLHRKKITPVSLFAHITGNKRSVETDGMGEFGPH